MKKVWSLLLVGISLPVNRQFKVTRSTSIKYFSHVLAALLLLFNTSRAQISFCQYLGGPYSETIYDLLVTSNGGYVVCGKHDSTMSLYGRCYMVKTNSSGDVVWSKTFGGGGNNFARGLAQTLDKGIVMAGSYSAQQAGDVEGYVVKFDSLGNLLWSDTIGGLFSEEFYSVCATSDGGCAVAGYTNSYGNAPQIFIVKLDVSGNIQWSRVFGTAGNEEAYSIQQTSDGGYIIGGLSSNWDGQLLKLDAAGFYLWDKIIGSGSAMTMHSLIQTSDGGYAAIAELWLFGSMDVAVIKTDNLGNQQWVKVFNRGNTEIGYDIVQNSKGELIIASTMNNSGYYGMVAKLDTNGVLLSENWLGSGSDHVDLRAIALTTQGEIVVAGNYANNFGVQDAFLALLYTAGTNCCTFSYSGSDSLMSNIGGSSLSLAVIPVTPTTGSAASIGPAGVNKSILCNQCGGLAVSLSSNDTTICYGSTLVINAIVNGGTAPFSYQWTPGGQNTFSITITPQESATYSVTVTDSSGTCSITKFVEIRVGPLDSVSVNPSVCPGYSAVLAGYGGANFSWSTGETTSSITVTPLSTTAYTMSAIDIYNCTHTYNFTVTVGPCPPTAQFCATYLVTSFTNYWAYGLAQTPDGGYLMTGFGNGHMPVLKVDAQGNIIWSKEVGDACPSCDAGGFNALVMHDGNYLIGGTYDYTGNQSEAYLICFDPGGNLLWRKAYDYFDNLSTQALIQCADKGIMMASNYYFSANPQAILITKTDSLGNLQWTRSYYDTTNKDVGALRLVQTSDGGIAVGGGINLGLGMSNMLLMRLDINGNVLWQKTVGAVNSTDILYDMIETKDKGFILCGMTYTHGFPGGDTYLIKLDSAGQLLWTRTWGYNNSSNLDYGSSVVETLDGSLVVTGSASQSGTVNNAYLAKFDANGNHVWTRLSNTASTVFHRVINTSDGGLAGAGLVFTSGSSSEFYFAKTDSLGQSCCMVAGGGSVSSGGSLTNLSAIKSVVNVVAVVQPLVLNAGLVNGTNCNPVGIESGAVAGDEVRIYPNPSKDDITIELENESGLASVKVYDMLGSECLTETFDGKKKTFSLSELKSGAYFFTVIVGGKRSIHKVIVMKD